MTLAGWQPDEEGASGCRRLVLDAANQRWSRSRSLRREPQPAAPATPSPRDPEQGTREAVTHSRHTMIHVLP